MCEQEEAKSGRKLWYEHCCGLFMLLLCPAKKSTALRTAKVYHHRQPKGNSLRDNGQSIKRDTVGAKGLHEEVLILFNSFIFPPSLKSQSMHHIDSRSLSLAIIIIAHSYEDI